MKPAHKSNTNQTAVAMAVAAVALAVLKQQGIDVRAPVEAVTGMSLEAVMAQAMVAAASAIVYFRERGRPRDEQDVVTLRPKS